MRKNSKALSILLAASITITPMASFAMEVTAVPAAGNEQAGTEQKGRIMDGQDKMMPPYELGQKPLSEKDKAAVAFAKEKYKELFGKTVNDSLYIMEVYFSSSDTFYPLPYYFRNTVSVSFIPKDYMKPGIYVSYYEDNKELMSISDMDVDYEAKIIYTKDQAKKIAEDFLNDNKLADISSYKLMVNSYQDPYMQNYPVADFYYIKQVNGLAFDADSLSVSVDLNKGKVMNFYKSSMQDLEFPSAKAELSEQEALAIVRKNTKVNLRYMTDMKNQKIAIPVYSIDTSLSNEIDAKTKEILNYNSDMKIQTFKPDQKRADEIINSAKPFSQGAVTRQQAVLLATKAVKELYGKDLKPNTQEDYYDMENAFFTFNDITDKDNKMQYSVGIELRTGMITYISGYTLYEEPAVNEMAEPYMPMPEQTIDYVPISYEKAYYAALEYAARLYPEQLKHAELEQIRYIYTGDNYPVTEYSFMFSRTENNISYPENSVNVTVNSKEASLMSLSSYWEDKKLFVDPAKIISEEKALDVFFSDKQMVLKYMLDYSVNGKNDGPAVKLIYSLSPKNNQFMSWDIDALTGKFIVYPMMTIDKVDLITN